MPHFGTMVPMELFVSNDSITLFHVCRLTHNSSRTSNREHYLLRILKKKKHNCTTSTATNQWRSKAMIMVPVLHLIVEDIYIG